MATMFGLDGQPDEGMDRQALLAQMGGRQARERGGVTGGPAVERARAEAGGLAAPAGDAGAVEAARNAAKGIAGPGTSVSGANPMTGGTVSASEIDKLPGMSGATIPKQDFSQFGSFMGDKNAALDPQKVASLHDSPKYQIARVLSHFDPSQGLTPDVLEALNSLGIGQFASDNGQYLRVSGSADPRFEGVLGSDMVRNFSKEGEAKRWGGWGSVGAEGPGVQPESRAPMAGGMGAGPSSFAGIQSLMPTDTNTFETLQRRMMEILGGEQAFDRDALIAQMSR